MKLTIRETILYVKKKIKSNMSAGQCIKYKAILNIVIKNIDYGKKLDDFMDYELPRSINEAKLG